MPGIGGTADTDLMRQESWVWRTALAIHFCFIRFLCGYFPPILGDAHSIVLRLLRPLLGRTGMVYLRSPVALGRHKIRCWGRKPAFSCGSGKPLLSCFVGWAIDRHPEHRRFLRVTCHLDGDELAQEGAEGLGILTSDHTQVLNAAERAECLHD